MSQEQPNSQPPLSPKPEAGQSEISLNKETQTLHKTWSRVHVVLTSQSIKALRGTIQVLEGVLVKLEAEPPAGTTPSFLDKLQSGWSNAIAKIRSLLPENLNQKLSDTALTGILAGIAVVVVWSASALLPGKASDVANVPPSEQVPAVNITTPSELAAPAEPKPIEVIPPPPVPTPTPTPTILTPEQNLIASIENQVAEITNQYGNGLIQSIQANFEGSSLTIKVTQDWYTLKQSQQDKLAAQMLERSKELDFSHLEITDPQGTLLARSPVVGTDMVILKRQENSNQQQEALNSLQHPHAPVKATA